MNTTTKSNRRHFKGFPRTIQASNNGPIFLQESLSHMSSPQNSFILSQNMGVSPEKPLNIFKNLNINLQSGHLDQISENGSKNVIRVQRIFKKSLEIPRDQVLDSREPSD